MQYEEISIAHPSREEVSKEFIKGNRKDLTSFEVKLNIKTPSYSYEKRKQMLIRWATVRSCKWFDDEDSKSFILDAIKNQNVLPTPLNVEQFTQATVNILGKNKLQEKLNSKSEETAISFADEIKAMAPYQILFLSFPFISDRFSVNFIKDEYQKLIIKDEYQKFFLRLLACEELLTLGFFLEGIVLISPLKAHRGCEL